MSDVGFGIIGCGNIAPIHADSIAEVDGARLIAVADVVEENAREFGKKYDVEAYGDIPSLLERDDILAVSICVPSGLRAEVAEQCAASGKHILAEKPLEVTTEKIDRIIAAVDKAGVKLGCVFQNRFADGPAYVRQALDEGRFGKLVMGDAYIKWYRSQEYYDSGAWRGTWKLDGGGCLMNQGIHQIDLLTWFMGPVKRVQARTDLVAHTGIEVEDVAVALLEFENGAFGVIEGSTAIWPGHPARVEVHGTEGSVVLEDGELHHWQFRSESEMDETIHAFLGKDADLGSGASDPMANLKNEGHRRQIEDFVGAIQDNREPSIDGREGRRAVALIEAIYRSAKEARAVDVRE